MHLFKRYNETRKNNISLSRKRRNGEKIQNTNEERSPAIPRCSMIYAQQFHPFRLPPPLQPTSIFRLAVASNIIIAEFRRIFFGSATARQDPPRITWKLHVQTLSVAGCYFYVDIFPMIRPFLVCDPSDLSDQR